MAVKKASPLFGKVNVYDPKGIKQRVEIYIRLDQRVEGLKIGVAIDGSASMQPNFAAHLPKLFRQPGQNIMEPVVRSLTRFLCKSSGDGSVNVIYWAVNPGGKEIEKIGNINTELVETMGVEGPIAKTWGGGTQLLPVINYYMKEYDLHLKETEKKPEPWFFLLVITDGELQDLEDVKKRCLEIGQKMVAHEIGNCKFVIVGVGPEVNQEQLKSLDDMFEGTPLEGKVDLWSSKLASEMTELPEIMDEIDFGVTIPGKIRIMDDKGKEALVYADGFPQRLEFFVPAGTAYVTIEIAGQKIKQSLKE